MKSAQQVVTEVPLAEVWSDSGVVSRERVSYLDANDIKSLLQSGRVRFVVADPGLQLEWIDISRCFEFWKTEVKPHLANPNRDEHCLEDFPDGYYYLASRWSDGDAEPIVLLEMQH